MKELYILMKCGKYEKSGAFFMYEYFYELDKLNDFSVLLLNCNYLEEEFYSVEPSLTLDFWAKNVNLFANLKKIDNLIQPLFYEMMKNKNRQYCLDDYEKLSVIFDYFNNKEEYEEMKNEKDNLQLKTRDLEIVLKYYKVCTEGLLKIYPDLSCFLTTTIKMIDDALKELDKKRFIQIPYNNSVMYTFPNAWYITPNGYLYNTGSGHKQGNLSYPYEDILDRLKNSQEIPLVDNRNKIRNILKRGWVEVVEFKNYANLEYEIPTVMATDPSPVYQLRKSYQKNIATLVIGHLAAKEALYKSFSRMNSSNYKQQLASYFSSHKIDLDEILVRYCGFHKISSVIDKTITTSSLNAIDDLKLYLDKGWTIDIIPGIVYDREKDKLEDVNFNSYFVNNILNKSLNEYNGKGKILIKDYKSGC